MAPRVMASTTTAPVQGNNSKLSVLVAASQQSTTQGATKKQRRYCRTPGCTRIVKSQGLCQRHGAKPRKCRVADCDKQAQGNFDGMCKSHFKAHKRQATPLPKKPDPQASEPPPPEGESVYDHVIPASLAWKPSDGGEMPLIEHLSHGFLNSKPPAWHRNEERRARGLWPVHNSATQLEGWERELVWMEILLLTGNPASSFRHLARGWGRDKGFHMVMAQFICERQGDVERKKRNRQGRKREEGDEDFHDDVGADVWDASVYNDVQYNEELAAELLDFSANSQGHMQSSTERILLEMENSEEDVAEDADDDDPAGDDTNSTTDEVMNEDEEAGEYVAEDEPPGDDEEYQLEAV